MDKRNYKKRTAWTETAELMLLQMWEDKILQLRGNRKNQHVYAEIAAELQKNGFPASALDVKTKVHNLTARYKMEKALVGPSGGSPSDWPFYERLHALLGSYRYYKLSVILCDSIPAPSAASTKSKYESSASYTSDCTLDSMYESESYTISMEIGSAAPVAASTSIQIGSSTSSPSIDTTSASTSTQMGSAAASPSYPRSLPLASPTLSTPEAATPAFPEKKNEITKYYCKGNK